MRVIYVDEAGTSAHEPLTVVVGVIVHGDTQWIAAANAIREATLRWVPKQLLQDGFIFHAKDLVSKKYANSWSFENRLALLHRMMKIPRTLNIPIALGVVVKEKLPLVGKLQFGKITKNDSAHAIAFACSMAMVGKFLRQYGGVREIGIVVAEDLPEMRTALKRVFAFLRSNERMVRPIRAMSSSGEESESEKMQFSAREVIDTVHFAAKSEALFLQLADACAFGLRRFISGLSHGDAYGKLIIGDSPDLMGYRDVLTKEEASAALYYDAHKSKLNISYSVS